MQRRHVGLGPGLIDRNETPGIDAFLITFPALREARHVRRILFRRQQAFLSLRPSRCTVTVSLPLPPADEASLPAWRTAALAEIKIQRLSPILVTAAVEIQACVTAIAIEGIGSRVRQSPSVNVQPRCNRWRPRCGIRCDNRHILEMAVEYPEFCNAVRAGKEPADNRVKRYL